MLASLRLRSSPDNEFYFRKRFKWSCIRFALFFLQLEASYGGVKFLVADKFQSEKNGTFCFVVSYDTDLRKFLEKIDWKMYFLTAFRRQLLRRKSDIENSIGKWCVLQHQVGDFQVHMNLNQLIYTRQLH